ncbi:MAG: hypothetical protein ACOYXA_14505 [Bacteroidota bacterium]
MTHVKNVEALTRLVSLCSGYGGTYNPGRQTLQVKALASQLSQARQALQNVVLTKSRYEQVVTQRELKFREAVQVARKAVRTLGTFDIERQRMDDIRALLRLLGGTKKYKPPVALPEGEEPKAGRSKPRAYPSRAQYFAELVQAIQLEPLYRSNEASLTKESLTTLAAQLEALNRQVAEAYAAWSHARKVRNQLLYTNAQSVHQVIKAVKDYVSVLFGTTSEEYRQVMQLSFTKMYR